MTALFALAGRMLALLGSRAGLAAIGTTAALDLGPFGNGGDGRRLIHVGGHPARRRRRRALTASDKADIAFISGTLGKPAGKDFAMIVAART